MFTTKSLQTSMLIGLASLSAVSCCTTQPVQAPCPKVERVEAPPLHPPLYYSKTYTCILTSDQPLSCLSSKQTPISPTAAQQ